MNLDFSSLLFRLQSICQFSRESYLKRIQREEDRNHDETELQRASESMRLFYFLLAVCYS